MTNLQSAQATEFGAFLEQLRRADPRNGEKVSKLLIQINEAADECAITIKEWRELVVMASRVRRTARAPSVSAR